MGDINSELRPDRLKIAFTPDEEAPSFGVMQLKSFEVVDGTPVVTTEQVEKDGGEGTIYINGMGVVGLNKHGGCTLAQTPVKVLYDTGDGTPAAGSTWGPKKDTWKLGKDIDGFVVQGEVDSTAGTMYVVASNKPTIKFAKLNAALNQGDSCTATIWSGDPLANSGNSETVYDWFLEANMKLVSGVKVMLTPISGKLYVTQSDTCPVAQ